MIIQLKNDYFLYLFVQVMFFAWYCIQMQIILGDSVENSLCIFEHTLDLWPSVREGGLMASVMHLRRVQHTLHSLDKRLHMCWLRHSWMASIRILCASFLLGLVQAMTANPSDSSPCRSRSRLARLLRTSRSQGNLPSRPFPHASPWVRGWTQIQMTV